MKISLQIERLHFSFIFIFLNKTQKRSQKNIWKIYKFSHEINMEKLKNNVNKIKKE